MYYYSIAINTAIFQGVLLLYYTIVYIPLDSMEIMDDMSCIRPDYDGLLECLTIKIGDLVKDTNFSNDVNKYYSVESYLDEHGTLSSPIARKELGIVYPKRLFTDLVNRGVLEWAHHNSVVDVVRVGFGSED